MKININNHYNQALGKILPVLLCMGMGIGITSCRKYKLEEDTGLTGYKSCYKRLPGIWGLNRIYVNGLDSTIYLTNDTLNMIKWFKISSNSGTMAFKRINDDFFSDEVYPFKFYPPDTSSINISTNNIYPARIFFSYSVHYDNVLFINSHPRELKNYGMVWEKYKFYYLDGRIKKIKGINYYGARYAIRKLDKKEMVWEYYIDGTKYRLEFTKICN